jgi:hypothetical protein
MSNWAIMNPTGKQTLMSLYFFIAYENAHGVLGLKSQLSLLTQKVQTTVERVKNEVKRLSKEIEQQIDQDMSYDPLHIPQNEESVDEAQQDTSSLPWNAFGEGNERLKEAILDLAKDRRNLLTNPPETSDFVFHMDTYLSMAKVGFIEEKKLWTLIIEVCRPYYMWMII